MHKSIDVELNISDRIIGGWGCSRKGFPLTSTPEQFRETKTLFITSIRAPRVLEKFGTFWGGGSLLTGASEEAGVHDDCGG